MVKIYETINEVRLVITVGVGTETQTISFTGGRLYPNRRNGTFRTDDKRLQDALESDTAYGVEYRLKESIEVTKENTPLLTVEEVTNRQSAIEWMRRKLGIKFGITAKSETIIARAADSGYVFINWIIK